MRNPMRPDSIGAGAPVEIEVTPAMMEAGARVLEDICSTHGYDARRSLEAILRALSGASESVRLVPRRRA